MFILLPDSPDKLVDCALDYPVPHIWPYYICRLGIGVPDHNPPSTRSFPRSPPEDWPGTLSALPYATSCWRHRPLFQIPIYLPTPRSAQLLSRILWPLDNYSCSIPGDHQNLHRLPFNNRVWCHLEIYRHTMACSLNGLRRRVDYIKFHRQLKTLG